MHPSQPEQEIDLELIAALVDGRLGGTERERALRLLAQSDHAREVFAEAVRVTSDPAVHGILPLPLDRRAQRLRRWRVVVPIAAAAALAIAFVPGLLTRSPDRLVLASSELAAPLVRDANAAAVLGPSWEQRPWSVLRGGPSPHADSSLSFRLGVRSLDLRVALELGDVELADRLAGEIVGWLGSVDFAESAAADYRALRARIASAPSTNDLLTDAARLETRMGELLHPFWFAFGQWCGAGELATRVRDEAFFELPITTRVLNEALESGRFAEADAGALQAIDALRQDSASARYDRARDLFQSLIRRHGG